MRMTTTPIDKPTVELRAGFSSRSHQLRGRRRLSFLLLPLILILATACGSATNAPGVANIVATTASEPGNAVGTPTTSTGSQGNPVAYAQCMRSHGIPDFPDPNANGNFTIQAGPGSDLDPSSPAFQSADNACKAFKPVASAAQKQQRRAQMLKHSQCMRSHGIPDFPDPNADGSIMISGHPGSDLNPNNPTFQAAQKACQSLLPGGKSGASTSTSSGGGN